MFAVAPIVCVVFVLYTSFFSILSNLSLILQRKREIFLHFNCVESVCLLCFFLMLQYVILAFRRLGVKRLNTFCNCSIAAFLLFFFFKFYMNVSSP